MEHLFADFFFAILGYKFQTTNAGSSYMAPIFELMNNVDHVLDNLSLLNDFLLHHASTECTILISCFAHLIKMFCACQ